MKDSADDQDAAVATANQEVPRTADTSTARVVATLCQMPGEDPIAQLWAHRPPYIITVRGRVSNTCGDQCLVALARFLPELVL
ncbi:hypothetical protein [Janibacter cremeus]|uniref:Uncharacterized protein n=1 Tax=Janibacter cremeus TaxID=1285192 RepID=A0A852VS93_9MICO|nr:hypothetical protein [Janibacter cremeus]NYF98819.1 hypothetical protein [Janibacter cremeus]